ncbi:MAG: aminotransferase class IV [Candidatus Omnitrophica bacterium]|nr:aminotransferase class IV [Candidatus Omnitrophota bacterium]
MNGRIVPREKAVVYSQDPGFLYGFGVFETLLVCEGKPVFLKEHIGRLRNNARTLGIYIGKDLRAGINAVLNKADFKTARMRVNAWKGVKGSNILISLNSFTPPTGAEYDRGFKVIISRFRINELSGIAGIKSLNYLINALAREEAEKMEADEALLLNTRGLVAEGSRSNIFLVENGKLITPALSCGCLAGITRKVIMDAAERSGIEVIEKDVRPDHLFKAREVFIANSLIGLMPVARINNRRINRSGKDGIYKLLAREYNK